MDPRSKNFRPTILVAGYYGFGNTGDEAILQAILEGLRESSPGASPIVVSGNPASTTAQHRVDAVEWRDVGAISQAVERCDLVIVGGGGLFQDHWGFDTETLLTPDHYGITFYAGPAALAALFGKPLALVGLGVGPLRSPQARRLVQGVCEATSHLGVRDAESRELLIGCGIDASRIVLSADAAFALEAGRISPGELARAAGVEPRSPLVAVALRPWTLDADPEHWEGEVAAALDRFIAATGGTLLLAPFQQSDRPDEDDVRVAQRVRQRLEAPERAAVLAAPLPPSDAAGLLAGCDLVVAMRLHAAIFAITHGVPVVGIAYDPKVRSLLTGLGLASLVEPLAGLSGWSLQARMESALEAGKGLGTRVAERAREQRDRAEADVRAAAALLERGEAAPVLIFTEATRELLAHAATAAVYRGERLASRNEALTEALSSVRRHAADLAATLSVKEAEGFRAQRQIPILTQELAFARRELQEFQASRLWRVADLYWRARRFAHRLLRGRETPPGPAASPEPEAAPTPAREFGESDPQLAHVLERVRESRGAVIFLPSIGWGIHLVQRPHHLARVLARRGFLVIFDCSNSADKVDGFREVEPGLFLFKGRPERLHAVPSPLLWAFPYNVPAAEAFPEGASIVYDWIDDLDVFPYDRALLSRNHERALAGAKLVLCVARRLHEEALRVRPDALYVPNGVEHERFLAPARAPEDDALGRFLAGGGPVAGYYGALARWFDYALLDEVARDNPQWRFVLIGQELDDSLARQPLLKRGNVLWLGPRDYETLPGYLSVFDVATIPFKIDSITLSTSPLKLFEYFAGGKPVVTTPMPECEAFPEVEIAGDGPAFSAALAKAREKGKDPGFRERLRALAAANSWEARVDTVLAGLSSARGEAAAPARGRDGDGQPGFCNICGRSTRFLGSDPALYRESLNCAHCLATSRYRSIARGLLEAFRALAGVDARSLAALPEGGVSRRLSVYDTQTPFSTGASAYPIPELLSRCAWIDLHLSTYRASEESGKPLAPRTTNQNLERLTFEDASFDVVVTSDVMEHVRLDDRAHREIRRVLRPGGVYLFTVPHFRNRETLRRVEIVDPADPSRDRHLMEPEYHGNANAQDGRALAYRGYGTDLDETLRTLGFSVEYTKQDFPENGIRNTELFFCRVES